MSLISKDAVQAAFDNADADVIADYGPEYGMECGFSREAVNRILTTAFASEKHFEPGQIVWVVDRDKDGVAWDISTYVFLAEVARYVILSPCLNGSGDLEYLLDYHLRDTYMGHRAGMSVVLIDDCFATRKSAQAAINA